MFKNVASQKLTVFAFDSTTNLPKTGDAANITAYVSIDGGAVTVLGDTTGTELDSTNAKGYYSFDVAQSETNGDKLLFSAKSSTSNIVVVAVPAVVYTVPANFTAASIDSSGKVLLQATQTGVTIPTVTTVTNQLTGAQIASAICQNTTAGDFTVAGSFGKSIMNGVTLGTGLTIASVSGSVGSVTGAVGSVTGNVGGNVAGSVASVTGAVGSVTGNVGGNVVGSVASVTGAVGSVTGSVGSISGVTFPSNFGSLAITAAGIAKADLQTILTTALSESSAGYLAASFKKLHNVASPALTTASVNQTGDSYALIGATGSGLTSLAPASTALSTAQWTGTRAGYLDNLSAGAVALASGVTLAASQPNYAPAKAGDQMALTSAYDFAKGTVAVTESYNSDGSAPTPVQALMAIMQTLTEFSISGTSLTVKKLDGSTTAMVLTLNDATTPTAATRSS